MTTQKNKSHVIFLQFLSREISERFIHGINTEIFKIHHFKDEIMNQIEIQLRNKKHLALRDLTRAA